MTEFISWSDAFALVGRAKYGSDWIGRLTEREQYLIEQYCDDVVSKRSPLVPGSIVWTQRYKLRPLGATLQDEVGRAEDRQRWKVIQDEYVAKWLTRNGFDSSRVKFCKLEQELLAKFGGADEALRQFKGGLSIERLTSLYGASGAIVIASPSQTAKDGITDQLPAPAEESRPRRRKRSPVKDKIIENMQNAIEAGEITLDDLITMRDEDRADRFGTKKRPVSGTKNGAHPQRTYVAEALNILLSRLQSRQIAKNDK